MSDEPLYPVPGRSELRNRRIASHEIGHACISRMLGNTVHSVTIVRGENFEGRCIRSGPASEIVFEENPEAQTNEIISVCDRLAKLQPELGSARVADSEIVVRAQSAVIELVAGRLAEEILFPDQPALGAVHDDIEAAAFARVSVAAEPAVAALIRYCEVEAHSLIAANIDIMDALMSALIEHGTLSGVEVDQIISETISVRSRNAERSRRADWKRRESNAATFQGEHLKC